MGVLFEIAYQSWGNRGADEEDSTGNLGLQWQPHSQYIGHLLWANILGTYYGPGTVIDMLRTAC